MENLPFRQTGCHLSRPRMQTAPRIPGLNQAVEVASARLGRSRGGEETATTAETRTGRSLSGGQPCV
jgi:hypothetical protein